MSENAVPGSQTDPASTRVLPVTASVPAPRAGSASGGDPAAPRTEVAPQQGTPGPAAEPRRQPSLWRRITHHEAAADTVSGATERSAGTPGLRTEGAAGLGAGTVEQSRDASAAGAAAGTDSSTGPAAPPRPPRPAGAGPRRVRLAVSRIDPWAVMKLSFLLSIAAGIALVVATAVVWNVLNSMQVFTMLDGLITDIAGTESFINILEYVEFSRVLSISVVIAVVDIVILTALATFGAFLYNVVAALVGGLHVTLTDE